MKKNHKTSIGGQAVIEGVMMRGPALSALAVRTPGGDISLEQWENPPTTAWYRKAPFIRGIFNFGSSLSLGYKCLMRSATIAGFEEESSKFDQWLEKKIGKSRLSAAAQIFSLIVGIALAIGLFTVLPTVLVGFVSGFFESNILRSAIEGAVRIAILVLYMVAVSYIPDIRRVFSYHGAEHKTIACYESGEALTVDNVRTKSRFHPRCGTSFLLIVMVISILVFSFISWENVFTRVFLRIALLPVVVGIAYEIIKLTGRHSNPFTRLIASPGLWLQKITTNEPDDAQIEVAIASMQPVIPQEQGSDEW